jgi:hypothetical protein
VVERDRGTKAVYELMLRRNIPVDIEGYFLQQHMRVFEKRCAFRIL